MEVVNLTFRSLYPWDTMPITIEWEAAWAQEPVWTLWRREKSLVLTGIRTRDLPARTRVCMFLIYHRQYISVNLWQLRWSRGSVLAFSTQVRGFKPGRSRRIFRGEKILSTPSFGGEVKPSVPYRRFAACKRSLIGVEVVISAKLPDNILAHSSNFRRWDLSRRGGRGGTWW